MRKALVATDYTTGLGRAFQGYVSLRDAAYLTALERGSCLSRERMSDMNPYAILGSGVGTAEAASLCARVTVWHDAMVAHERRLRMGRAGDACDDECPHVEARTLWAEAVTTLGSRANELTFLRSRAVASGRNSEEVVTPAEGAGAARRHRSRSRGHS